MEGFEWSRTRFSHVRHSRTRDEVRVDRAAPSRCSMKHLWVEANEGHPWSIGVHDKNKQHCIARHARRRSPAYVGVPAMSVASSGMADETGCRIASTGSSTGTAGGGAVRMCMGSPARQHDRWHAVALRLPSIRSPLPHPVRTCHPQMNPAREADHHDAE